MDARFQCAYTPKSDPAAMIQGERYRFTVLTSRLIRMEYSPDGIFEDRATQMAINRNFPAIPFRLAETENRLTLQTEDLLLEYDKKPFSPQGLSVSLPHMVTVGKQRALWHYGDALETLYGTARTLDEVDGATELEAGILSRKGFSVVDDSHSLTFTPDGWVEPRSSQESDLYFFGYGHAYADCLRDFYTLSGKAPLIPRYALGNWWSRYYPYSEETYKELMARFKKEQVPLSVAVMDMDWHWVKEVDPKYGSGWTGYSWNRDLFPDPAAFLKWLHAQKLKTTLNLHPAEGVRAFEDAYLPMAKQLNINTENEDAIAFDITDPAFAKAYFEQLHHPLEEQGVDFWWIDWQQGSNSGATGLDPLWLLNHLHYLDSKRRGSRPLTFSRYAGLGSHRYPIGFSGDTHITWESLAFQPYFTATASNVGYGWWSHDIGGHKRGRRDDELAARWVQLGVFSPIMRLHSSKGLFASKEPWLYTLTAQKAMIDFLRLRHRLIPYLYTMNYNASRNGTPLVRPLYYQYPEADEAYQAPNQYLFGSELMVCPITEPAAKELGMAKCKAWLPKGQWFDFFTGHSYWGEQWLSLWRTLETIPVLAKAGSIIPLDGAEVLENGVDLPKSIEVHVFPGSDGDFILREDEGNTLDDQDDQWANTRFHWVWDQAKFTIYPANQNLSVLPEKRNWRIHFRSIAITRVHVTVQGSTAEAGSFYDETTQSLCVSIASAAANAEIRITLEEADIALNPVDKEVYQILLHAQIGTLLKETIYRIVTANKDPAAKLAALRTLDEMPPAMFDALCETLI